MICHLVFDPDYTQAEQSRANRPDYLFHGLRSTVKPLKVKKPLLKVLTFCVSTRYRYAETERGKALRGIQRGLISTIVSGKWHFPPIDRICSLEHEPAK